MKKSAATLICRFSILTIQFFQAMNRKVTGAKIKEVIAQAAPDHSRCRADEHRSLSVFRVKHKKDLKDCSILCAKQSLTILVFLLIRGKKEQAAAQLKSQISEKEKERRREIIMSEQAAISHAINKSLIGSIQEVLIEEKSDRPDYDFMGRCRRQAPEIDGITYVKGKQAKIGSIVKCKIIAADDYDLFGEII